MNKMKINKNIAVFIISFSFFVQLIIISYNHLTGFKIIDSIFKLIIGLSFATFLTALAAIYLYFTNNIIIDFLNKRYKWESHLHIRIPLELLAAIINVILPSAIITVIAHNINPYQNGLEINLINNILISSVINILFVVGMEGFLFYKNWKESNQRVNQLEFQTTIAKLESLKNQLNPHFLFNSLNVLSSLINKDTKSAQLFINDFSQIYRYILETSDMQVIKLKDELDFCRSYFKLNQFRFANSINMQINLDNDLLNKLIPPLALQLTIENAIKHNIIDVDKPLNIKLYFDDAMIIIENNYQPRISDNNSKGMGIKNLTKRYEFLSDKKPEFSIVNDKFIAKLPIIDEE